MPELCTKDGCNKKWKARGLCSTHYNQTLPNRHRKITLTCECCQGPAIKEARQHRYETVYCSELCRDYHRWGPTTSLLPRTHWARMIGMTCAWNAPAKKEPESIICQWCGGSSDTLSPTKTYCDDRCARKAAKVRRRARQYGAHGTYTWSQVVHLWVAFDKACAYCRTQIPLADTQAEHVIALARGGANNIGNILPSCAQCNADKRDLDMDEWKTDRERRHLPPVITHWDWNDPRYRHLAGGAMGLAA